MACTMKFGSQGLFLDRDGVIIENRANYVRSWSDVAFLPGVLEALAVLATLPHKIVVVTNQSAVGRAIITLSEAEAINKRLLETIKGAGGRIDALKMCPHAPENNCQCRKPLPGLLLQAANELEIQLDGSVMVGDALTDLQAGQAVGIRESYLVLSGRGFLQSRLPEATNLEPYRVINTLVDLPAILLKPPGPDMAGTH